jgi:predicted SprT family Zn-dependent metalloprotease
MAVKAKVLPPRKTVPSKPFNYTQALADWATSWRTPQLPGRVTVTFSGRMTKSLGRVRPMTGQIRLNSKLQTVPRRFLLEVLCHEAAHVAVHLLHGANAKPHGPEWQELVRIAGYQPATKLGHQALTQKAPQNTTISRHRYRCRICQCDYFVRRKSSRLHCNLCYSAGSPEPLQYLPNSSLS